MRPETIMAMAERKRRRNRMLFIRTVLRVIFVGLTLLLGLALLGRSATKDMSKKTVVYAYSATPDDAEQEAYCPDCMSLVEAASLEKSPADTCLENDLIAEEDRPLEISEEEVEMLACRIYWEAGGDDCSDLCRYYCGDVMLNRVEDPRFPDTLEGVLTQKSQYGRFYWTGIVWPERAKLPGEASAVQRAYDTARDLLSGNHSELYGSGYVYQAEFKQGKDIILLDGTYFGR